MILRLRNQRSRKVDPLLQAIGQHADAPVLNRIEIKERDDFQRTPPRVGRLDGGAAEADELLDKSRPRRAGETDHNVVEYAQVGKQREILESAGHAEM